MLGVRYQIIKVLVAVRKKVNVYNCYRSDCLFCGYVEFSLYYVCRKEMTKMFVFVKKCSKT